MKNQMRKPRVEEVVARTRTRNPRENARETKKIKSL